METKVIQTHPTTKLRITEDGNVIGPRGKILKPWINDGYRCIRALTPKNRAWKISRLVAETFIPNPENKPEVNHKNGNKTDDRVVNLEWNTRSENQLHAFRTGLQKPNIGELAGGVKLSEKQVREIRALANSKTHEEIARQMKVCRPNITLIINRKTWKHI